MTGFKHREWRTVVIWKKESDSNNNVCWCVNEVSGFPSIEYEIPEENIDEKLCRELVDEIKVFTFE